MSSWCWCIDIVYAFLPYNIPVCSLSLTSFSLSFIWLWGPGWAYICVLPASARMFRLMPSFLAYFFSPLGVDWLYRSFFKKQFLHCWFFSIDFLFSASLISAAIFLVSLEFQLPTFSVCRRWKLQSIFFVGLVAIFHLTMSADFSVCLLFLFEIGGCLIPPAIAVCLTEFCRLWLDVWLLSTCRLRTVVFKDCCALA